MGIEKATCDKCKCETTEVKQREEWMSDKNWYCEKCLQILRHEQTITSMQRNIEMEQKMIADSEKAISELSAKEPIKEIEQ